MVMHNETFACLRVWPSAEISSQSMEMELKNPRKTRIEHAYPRKKTLTLSSLASRGSGGPSVYFRMM